MLRECETTLSGVCEFPAKVDIDSMDMEIIRKVLREFNVGFLAKTLDALRNNFLIKI